MGLNPTKAERPKDASSASFAIIDKQDRLKAENLNTLAQSLRDLGDTDVTVLVERLALTKSVSWDCRVLELEKLRKDFHAEFQKKKLAELINRRTELREEQDEFQKKLEENLDDEEFQKNLDEKLQESVQEIKEITREIQKYMKEFTTDLW